MERKMVALVVAAVVGMTGTEFDSAVRGQTTAKAGAGSLSPPLLRETFDDNVPNPMWAVYVQDPNSCWVTQVDGRLELRANPGPAAVFAAYMSNAWRLDPTQDFSMKLDVHFRPLADATGWLGLGLTPNADEPCTRHISIGIGCANGAAHYWHEKQEGLQVASGRTQRFKDDATLYISYDASEDLLYVSDSGYGADKAWMTFPGVIRGQWGGAALHLVAGGGSAGLTIGPGEAFVDNLLVETGALVEPALQEVYRFWSPVYERHFYTASTLEKQELLAKYSYVWTYEGVVYHALQDNSDPACQPVHRFWSSLLCSHFYTIDAQEKDKLTRDYPYIWAYEGIAFYAYPPGRQPPWSKAVHRFWSESKGTHFYTMSEDERARLLGKFADVWTYEGIAWYAFE
jgi:hypothetical protein